MTYVADNDTVTQDTTTSDGTITYGKLAKTDIDNTFLADFQTKMADATSTAGTVIKSLSDMGFTTNRDGTITFDSDAFEKAAASDPTGASQVLNSFADAVGGTSGLIYSYTSYDGIIDTRQTSNTDSISDLNDKIAVLKAQGAEYQATLEKQFSNLESVSAKLQSQQSSLSAALASLS